MGAHSRAGAQHYNSMVLHHNDDDDDGDHRDHHEQDHEYEMTSKMKKWEHAILDLSSGQDIGCHNHCGELNVKLTYMTIFCLTWLVLGSLAFAALEDKDMQKYQKGAHEFDAMVAN